MLTFQNKTHFAPTSFENFIWAAKQDRDKLSIDMATVYKKKLVILRLCHENKKN